MHASWLAYVRGALIRVKGRAQRLDADGLRVDARRRLAGRPGWGEGERAVDQDQKNAPANRGTERRRGNERRKTSDRREEIRFEPEKDDRRSGKDRRKHGGWDDTPVR